MLTQTASRLRQVVRGCLLVGLCAAFSWLQSAPAQAQSKALFELVNRVYALDNAGKYAEALALAEQAVPRAEAELGSASEKTISLIGTQGELYSLVGRFGEAEATLKKALGLLRTARDPGRRNLASVLGTLATVYETQGRYEEAEDYFRRSIAIIEAERGADDPVIAGSLNNLSNVYRAQSRFADADAVLLRAIHIHEKTAGGSKLSLANSLASLGNSYLAQGRTSEAEPLYARSLAIREKALGPDHPDLLGSLVNIGRLYASEKKYPDAEAIYKRSLAIAEKALGTQHPDYAIILFNLASLYGQQGRPAEAMALNQQSLEIRNKTLPSDHPEIAQAYRNLGLEALRQGHATDALVALRRSAAIRTTRSLTATRQEKVGADSRNVYVNLAKAAWAVASEDTKQREALAAEAFEGAQYFERRAAGAALAQMAVRAAARDPLLAARVREQQDLAQKRETIDQALVQALSVPAAKKNEQRQAELRRESEGIEARLQTLSAAIAQQFPAYGELASGRALALADARRLLRPDEALVFYLSTQAEGTYVWALTRDASQWHRIALNDTEVSSKVASLRKGVDVVDLDKAAATGELFDLGLAHELYEALLGPVGALVKGKPNLIVVPSGPLTSLPFHMLVTEPARVAKPDASTLGVYGEAQWLIKRHAVTVLPSVSSLRALRVLANAAAAPRPLIGFGAPVFGTDAEMPATDRGPRAAQRTAAKTRAISSYYTGGRANAAALRSTLRPLPETADELRAIAKSVNAAESDLRLGAAASETTVKSTDLAPYRVVYFATHGLVSGDLVGLAEPALALSVPAVATEQDDGLLTASEVAQLRLNADWVVLSACNTAAAETPGAEALSGLARAFFYAGTRALLVSHWQVNSIAAVRLTTSTFAALQKEPGLGRAQALRRAMLDMIGDTSDPWNAYPDFWAPFSLIGEGGR